METAIFDGTLPPPWQIDFTQRGSVPWRTAGATVCLIVDVLFNMGGVAILLSNLDKAGLDNAGLSAGTVKIIGMLLIIPLSIFLCIGSEIMEEHADDLEGKTKSSFKAQSKQAPVEHLRGPAQPVSQIDNRQQRTTTEFTEQQRDLNRRNDSRDNTGRLGRG